VFQPLNEDELADIETLDRHSEQAASGQARHPDVLAHLERLQLKKSNPVSSLVVLLVSIGVFVALGMSVWGGGWKYILVIVGILLVHEAGHFIAMRMIRRHCADHNQAFFGKDATRRQNCREPPFCAQFIADAPTVLV